MQISQEGSIKSENVVVRETVYPDFGSGETFRSRDTFRKGPHGIEVIMFSNPIAMIGLMRTVSKQGDHPHQAIPENIAAGERAAIDRDLTEISVTFSSVPIGTSAPTERRGDSR